MSNKSKSLIKGVPATVTTATRGMLQRQCACGQHAAGGECGKCRKERGTSGLYPARQAEPVTVPAIVSDVLRSPGQPLDAPTRAFMEPRFGQDFSQVRVHTDAKAADSANAIHAQAYTVGRDIVFGSEKYLTPAGASRHLLAHELTHVVQQTTGGVGADSETRANAAADRVSQGKVIEGAAVGGAPISLQRSPKDDAHGKTRAAASVDSSAEPSSAEPSVDEFDFDKADIPPQHLARLAALRARLLNAPSATVILTGHTDTVGKEKYNEALGLRRAKAVRDFLSAKKGVNPSRIEVKSGGEFDPAAGQPPAKVDPEKGEKNPKNRRVEIQVIGLPAADTKTDLSSDHPTIETPPAPGKDKPIIPGPGRPMIKEICIVYPDLCNPPEPTRLPPDFWKPLPPAKRTQKSSLDVINEKLVDPVVKAVTKGLPKAVQEKILDLAHDGVEKGITSAASSAAAAAGLDSKEQQAIEKAVEAAIKYKGQQPGKEGGNQ